MSAETASKEFLEHFLGRSHPEDIAIGAAIIRKHQSPDIANIPNKEYAENIPNGEYHAPKIEPNMSKALAAAKETPYAVICSQHNRQFLTEKQYKNQMLLANSPWRCPVCRHNAEWDDDW